MSRNKHDEGKLRFDLIDPEFTRALAQVLTIGAAKYNEYSWQEVDNFKSRYTAALHRHLNEWQRGNLLDDEDGESHLVHAACNIMMLEWRDRNECTGLPGNGSKSGERDETSVAVSRSSNEIDYDKEVTVNLRASLYYCIALINKSAPLVRDRARLHDLLCKIGLTEFASSVNPS